jgi:hypothetical protein
MASGLKPSSAHTHSARLTCCGLAHAATHGLPGTGRWPTRAAHEPARPARAQRFGALERTRERARLAQQPAVHTPRSTVAQPAGSGYSMSHDKVFTVSTQGARRTRLTRLGGPTHS